MEQEVLMPLNIQLFADGGEEDNANNTNGNTQQVPVNQ